MGRSLKYEIPGDDPRLSMSEVSEIGWEACFDGSLDSRGLGSAPQLDTTGQAVHLAQ